MKIQSILISKITLFLGLSLTVFACQKVIDIPVNESSQKVVIEAVTSNFLGDSYVLLSRTASLYGPNQFQKINNGTVEITDKNGNQVTFSEDGDGIGRYVHPTFIVQPNNEYLLEVTVDGKTYSAKSSTQSLTTLNSFITTKIANIGFLGGEGNSQNDSINTVEMSYTDNANEENYYRFNVYTNGEEEGRLNIVNDKITNGQEINGSPSFGETYDSKDTVLLELVNMDKANYTYFYSLRNTSSNGPFSATPANPVTNIENDALGYFGAYLKDTLSVIIP